jgi:orotate phosphoribosyltransferase
VNAKAFYDLVDARRGHFLLESGLHAERWLDLDPLFADQRRLGPFVAELANAMRPHRVDVVCGALVGGAFLALLLAQALNAEFCFTERAMPSDVEALFQTRYSLPLGYVSRLSGKRIAIVDDVMSAGSALRGTYDELHRHALEPVVAGALLVLGNKGADFFATNGIPIVASVRDEFATWTPAECPLCASAVPLERRV